MNTANFFDIVTYFQKTESKYSYNFDFRCIPSFSSPERYPELEKVYQKYDSLRYQDDDSPIRNWMRYQISYYLTPKNQFDCDNCDEITTLFRALHWEIDTNPNGQPAIDSIFSFQSFWTKATLQKASGLNDRYLSKLVVTPAGKKTIQQIYYEKAQQHLEEFGCDLKHTRDLALKMWQYDAYEQYKAAIGAELFAELERYAALTFSLGNFMPCPPGNYSVAKDCSTNCLNDRFDFLLSFLKKYKAGKSSLGYTMKEKKYRVEEQEMIDWIAWFNTGLDDIPDLPRMRRYYLDSFFEGGFIDWNISELKLLPMAGTKLSDYLRVASDIMEDRGYRIAVEIKQVANMLVF